MKLPQRGRSPGFSMNLTPMIDVVFLLNIFFLVASYYIRHEQIDPVELPLASQGEEEGAAASRLVITVQADGSYLIGGEPDTLETIENRMRELLAESPQTAELRLRTDRQSEYAAVEPLLLKAADAGLTRIRFSVLPE